MMTIAADAPASSTTRKVRRRTAKRKPHTTAVERSLNAAETALGTAQEKIEKAATFAHQQAANAFNVTRKKAENLIERAGGIMPSWARTKEVCWTVIQRGKEMLLIGLDVTGKVVLTLAVFTVLAAPISWVLNSLAWMANAFWLGIATIFGLRAAAARSMNSGAVIVV